MVIAPSIGAVRPNSSCSATLVPLSPVFLPKEHGSWSLALEPILLGLLVAPSGSGVALAVAATALFFARRPFKALLSRSSQLHPAARCATIILGLCAGIGLAEAMAMGGTVSLWPLLLAAPFGGLFVYCEAQGDSRAAAAELAGSTAFGLLPASFATLAGWPVSAALALAGLTVARSGPTVLTVRTYLRRRKGRAASTLPPILASLLGGATVVGLATFRQIPWLATLGACLLLAWTVVLLSIRAPAWSARRVGTTEAILGIVYIILATLAYWSQPMSYLIAGS